MTPNYFVHLKLKTNVFSNFLTTYCCHIQPCNGKQVLLRAVGFFALCPNVAQSVNITKLNLLQLEMLKNQLDQEVEFLSTPIAQLKAVQTKYVEAKDCLKVLNRNNEGKELLVPLTSSVSGPRKLHAAEHVLIDVGTGYHIEKTAEEAKDFFKREIDFLTRQMEKIQPALQEKHAMKLAVMEMMNQKIQQLTARGAIQVAKAKDLVSENGQWGPTSSLGLRGGEEKGFVSMLAARFTDSGRSEVEARPGEKQYCKYPVGLQA
ncbi:prefoldin subunit 5-like [Artibeus jamaicensis]|uniref:prefoldin subunit 5-like n=1 Tax=Artibeus jamaicensis TaxID=9417 RepID=UPI00235A70AF|nr:prefoldin subunit 5-like [Artibeus jamaicensis]